MKGLTVLKDSEMQLILLPYTSHFIELEIRQRRIAVIN